MYSFECTESISAIWCSLRQICAVCLTSFIALPDEDQTFNEFAFYLRVYFSSFLPTMLYEVLTGFMTGLFSDDGSNENPSNSSSI